jgi:hypothetical protein
MPPNSRIRHGKYDYAFEGIESARRMKSPIESKIARVFSFDEAPAAHHIIQRQGAARASNAMLAKRRSSTEVPTSATPWLIGRLVNDILRSMRVATGQSNAKGCRTRS